MYTSKKIGKIAALLLALAFTLTFAPLCAWAAEEPQIPGQASSELTPIYVNMTGIEFREQEYFKPVESSPRFRAAPAAIGNPGPFNINDERDFRIQTGNGVYNTVKGKLIAQGINTNIWVIDDTDYHTKTSTAHNADCTLNDISPALASSMATDVDAIYARMTDGNTGFAPHAGVTVTMGYGNLPATGDLGGDSKVNFVLYDIAGDGAAGSGGTMGFFNSSDYFTYSGNDSRNNLDMLHIDIGKKQGYAKLTGTQEEKYALYGTLAHEFQHLLFYMYFGVYSPDQASYTWINESLADLAKTYYTVSGSELIDVSRMTSAAKNTYDGGTGTYSDFVNFIGGGNLKSYGMGNMLSRMLYKQQNTYPHDVYSHFTATYPPATDIAGRTNNELKFRVGGTTNGAIINMNSVWGDVWNSALALSAADGATAFKNTYFKFMENFAADGGNVDGLSTTKFSNSILPENNLWNLRAGAADIPLVTSGGAIALNGSGTGSYSRGATHEKFYKLTAPASGYPILKIAVNPTTDNADGFDKYYVVIPNNPGSGENGAEVYALTEGAVKTIDTAGKQAYLYAATLYQNVSTTVRYSYVTGAAEHVTISATREDFTYRDTGKTGFSNLSIVKTSDSTDVTATVDENYAVTYVGRGGTMYVEKSALPVNAGEYTAKIVVNDADYTGSTAVDFEILKKTAALTDIDIEQEFSPGLSGSFDIALDELISDTFETANPGIVGDSAFYTPVKVDTSTILGTPSLSGWALSIPYLATAADGQEATVTVKVTPLNYSPEYNIVVKVKCVTTAVAWSGLTADGTANTTDTTELTLTFDVEPVGLTESNITVTGAAKGTLSGTGTVRTLRISNITVAEGANVTVALTNPTGFSISPASKTVAVHKAPPAPTAVAWSGLTANGTANTTDTTELTLMTFTFDVEPTGLAGNNITVTGATKGTLSGTGTTRTLTISNITVADGANVTVALTNPTGFSISPTSRTVAVHKAPTAPPVPTAVAWSGLTANGTANTTDTTELTLTFDVEPVGLTGNNITVTGAAKGTLSGTGTVRTLRISNITVAEGANVTVALTNPTGFSINPASKTVAVHKAPPAPPIPTAVAWSGLTANGTANTTDTTELTLTFDVEPTGLTGNNITVTGATKGTLNGTGTARTLTISNISVAEGANVTVALTNPSGFSISPASRTVAVHKATPAPPPAPTAVAWSGLTANGTANTTDTTELTLTFDVEPVGLTGNNITVTGATKGTLSGTGTVRTLRISNITVAEGANVTVSLTNPTGFSISPASRTVAVHKAPATPPIVPKSTDAALSMLTISGVTLTPAFGANTTSYTANVPYSLSDVSITAVANEKHATVSGTGTKSLAVGVNTFTIIVTAEDGTTKTYTITITRASNSVIGGGGGGTGGGSSGGSGGSGNTSTSNSTSTEPKSETPVTAPAANNSTTVTYTPSGETAKVDLPAEKIDEIIKKSGDDVVDIDLSKAKDITEAQLPVTAIKEIAKSKAGLSVALPLGEVNLSEVALASLAGAANSSEIIIKVEKAVPADILNERQLAAVGDRPVYDISIISDGKYISSFDGGLLTISIPYSLKAGEKAHGVKVYYLGGDGNVHAVSAKYDAKSKCVIFTTDHLSKYYINYEKWVNIFTDVFGEDWYYDAVEYVNANGLMNGDGGLFTPGVTMTRAMLVTVLWRYEGAPETKALDNVFADVPENEWYADAVKWANANEIVVGANGLFSPNDPITREQLAVILYRYAQVKGLDTNITADLSYFGDSQLISDWAVYAMKWANGAGLVNGESAAALAPKNQASRAVVATIFMRFIENIVNQ